MKKRVLSLLLALVLTLSLTPAALAYDEPAAAYSGETAVYEEQASSIIRAPVPEQRDTALSDSSPDVTGWTEEILWSGPVSELGVQELYGAAISEEQVYRTINALRSTYYEGMYWTNESEKYTLSVPGYDQKDNNYYTLIGYGCVAFCYRLSDAAFGTSIARKVYNFTYDDIRVGDILRVNNDQHSVTVLQKYSDHVVLAEANYNSAVHWDRTMTRAEVMRSDYITTRYPANLTSLNVVADRTSIRPGEQVKVSVKSPLTTTYDIQVWKGARDTGTLEWSATGVAPSASYVLTRYETGTYTVYITSRNDDYQIISGTVTFRVSDGKPSNARIRTDKSSYSPGETVTISYSADDADSFSISVWRGAYGTGTLLTSKSGVTGSGATWQTTVAGTYTLYLEAVNSKGADSASCQFTVTTSAATVMPFTDVPAGVYYTDAVKWAINKGITTGTTLTTFSPNNTVTRGEAVTFLWRAMGEPAPSTTIEDIDFKDISPSEYYFQAVLWAVEKGVTTGVSTTEFDPSGTVTRGQMVTFLWRVMGKPGATGQGEWFADAERWARINSLLTGTASTYATNAACPRSDVVYYMWNALK